MQKIQTLAELKKIASGESSADCFIALAGGIVRSSKDIHYDGKVFEIFHGIDGSTETMTEKQLLKSNIGKALEVGALFLY